MVYGPPSAIADGRPARLAYGGVFEKHTEAGHRAYEEGARRIAKERLSENRGG